MKNYTEEIYDKINEELSENDEINIYRYEKVYNEIKDAFLDNLEDAMKKFEHKNKIFINAYDKNGEKLYVGDTIIYHRRKRTLQPADGPEFKGEISHGQDEFGQDLYYYTEKVFKLNGYVNSGKDYHKDCGGYISLYANGSYRPTNHIIEERIVVGKKENGRNIYEHKIIYCDIEKIFKKEGLKK